MTGKTVETKCKNCGKSYLTQQAALNAGFGRYCSLDCFLNKRMQSDREWNDEQCETPTPEDYYELQGQMNELQTELFNERQKSKELAAKVAGYEDTIKGECFRLQAGDVVAISLKREFFEQTETHEFYRQGLLKLMPPGVHVVLMAEGCTLRELGDHQLMQLGLVRATGTVETLAKRIVELDKLLSSANSRIAELGRDEPNHDDIVALRKALGKAAIAAPESDEELGIRWLSHVRHLIRSVSKWGFVAASERDALAAQLEALRSAIEPFATGGVCSAIDREDYSIMRERIKDWHGVIEFKKAQDAYNSTPQQCLRDVQAEARRAGWNACVDWLVENSSNLGWFSTYFTVSEFADKVRQGGAG